jgi:hypothetical protein
VHDHAGRLVDDECVIVFPDHLERDVFRDYGTIRRRRNVDGDALTRRRSVRRLLAAAINGDSPVGDEGSSGGARNIEA